MTSINSGAPPNRLPDNETRSNRSPDQIKNEINSAKQQLAQVQNARANFQGGGETTAEMTKKQEALLEEEKRLQKKIDALQLEWKKQQSDAEFAAGTGETSPSSLPSTPTTDAMIF